MSDVSVRFSCISDNSATTGEVTTSQQKKKTHRQQTAKLLLNDSKMLWLLNTSAFLIIGHVLRLCYYCVITDIIQEYLKASLEWLLFTALAVNWVETGVKKNETQPSNTLWFWTSVTWTVWMRTESLEWFSERRCDPQKKNKNKNAYQTDSDDSDGVRWLIVRILQLDLCVLPSKYYYTHLILMSCNHFKRCSRLEAVAGRRWRPV